MSFTNLPILNKGIVNPAMSPQTLPQMEMAQTPNRAQIRTNVNANMNESRNSKPSGRRAGGKGKSRKTNQRPSTPVAMFTRNRSDDTKSRSSLTVNQSDFGYDIGGSNTPASFSGSVDQTLFRDYNIVSKINDQGMTKLISNNITNTIKSLSLDLNASLANSGNYKSAYEVIYNIIYRDVASSTRGAAGALRAIERTGLMDYLTLVVGGFDILIDLETLQAWDPSDTSSFDRSLRKLASLASTTQLLEVRTKLRQSLIPHVLPLGWMKYIKWLRQTHLSGPASESTKLRFNSAKTINLIDLLSGNKDITVWAKDITDLADKISATDPSIPAIIMSNVTTVPFGNVKDHYSDVYKSASYDPEFCNLFNNRTVVWADGAVTSQYPKRTKSETAFAAFNTTTPYSLSLANLSSQVDKSGLPLEGDLVTVKVSNQVLEHSTFNLLEVSDNMFSIRGVERWFESRDDSTHTVDITSDKVLKAAVSMPRNNETMVFVAAESNISMAQRESFDSITMHG